jgi:hypothetical protein
MGLAQGGREEISGAFGRSPGRCIRQARRSRVSGRSHRMNEALADSLTAIVRSPEEPEQLRATAAIALGAALEQADIDEFDDPDHVPITESTFRNIQDSFQKLYFDDGVPKEVRRRVLEASVRAPEIWHPNAIAAAYSSGDRDWMLTAVFAMRWVRGFDDRILEALKSGDSEIHLRGRPSGR